MNFLRISILVFGVVSIELLTISPNPKRNEITWDESIRDMTFDITTSGVSFNANDTGSEVKSFERSREPKSHQMARYSEMGEIGQMRVYNVGVLMASHLGKCLGEWRNTSMS